MLPRRCQLSSLSWQQHANGDGVMAGAGLAVALLASSVRVLPWHAVVPGKDLAGGLVGFVGKKLVEDLCLPILI